MRKSRCEKKKSILVWRSIFRLNYVLQSKWDYLLHCKRLLNSNSIVVKSGRYTLIVNFNLISGRGLLLWMEKAANSFPVIIMVKIIHIQLLYHMYLVIFCCYYAAISRIWPLSFPVCVSEWHLICQIFPVEITLVLGHQERCAWIKYEIISTSFKFETNWAGKWQHAYHFYSWSECHLDDSRYFSRITNLLANLVVIHVVSKGIEI